MSRMKSNYILSTASKSGADSEKARKAIEAVREAVRVSKRSHTSKVNKARAAYIKALDDAISQFSSSRKL